MRAGEWLSGEIEQLYGPVDHVSRHPGVDFLGEFDKAEGIAERPDLVAQVVRVDGDTVATNARPGVEGLKSERLRRRAPDRVPQVDAEFMTEDRHLVDEGDVHVPVGILEQLGHLGLAGGPGPDHLVAQLAVELRGRVGAGLGLAADHLGCVANTEVGVPRVDPLGGERQREVGPRGEPGLLLQQWPHHFVGRSRVCRGFQQYEHAWPEQAPDGPGRRGHRGQVGRAIGRQRGGDADHDGLGQARLRLERRGPKTPRRHLRDISVRDVIHVRATSVQAGDYLGIQVKADHAEPG